MIREHGCRKADEHKIDRIIYEIDFYMIQLGGYLKGSVI
jgi:hypothetical protein